MNRTDRLVGIMLVLQGGRATSVPELARRFGVTRRTMYRDLAALGESGFPLASTAGRYTVPEGHRLTPIAFPPQEGAALLLGGRLLRAFGDRALTALVDAASARLETTLPPPVRRHTGELLASVEMRQSAHASRYHSGEFLGFLRAIATHRVATIRYTAAGTGEVSERTIEPMGLLLASDRWSVVAYCRLREDGRLFRGDRIERATFSDERFQPRPEVLERLGQPPRSSAEGVITAVLRASLGLTQRLRGTLESDVLREEMDGDCTRLTVRLPSLERALGFTLACGAEVEVLEPSSLREAVALEAEALHALYAIPYVKNVSTQSTRASA